MDTKNVTDRNDSVRRLMIFFAIVYLAEGFGQVGGLINQPLSFYLMKHFGMNAAQTTAYLSTLIIPWLMKPIWGLVSDFIPIFGYRRKSYLLIANSLAVLGFLALLGVTQLSEIIIALMLTAFGMAVSSTVCGGLLVEFGKESKQSGKFVNQQWLFFNIAAVITSISGGWLAQHLGPTNGFHTAAMVVAIAPMAVMVGSWIFISEKRTKLDKAELLDHLKDLKAALKTKSLWIAAGFLFMFNFAPGFGTPLYYYMSNHLHFSQQLIGNLGACGAVGSIIGAFVYKFLSKHLSLKGLLIIAIIAGTISQLGYIFLYNEQIAIALALINGVITMISLVASLTLAANMCPDGSEGFFYALLMAVNDLAGQASTNIGALLYVHVFNSHLNPLIIVSAAFTLFAIVLMPFLKLNKSHRG